MAQANDRRLLLAEIRPLEVRVHGMRFVQRAGSWRLRAVEEETPNLQQTRYSLFRKSRGAVGRTRTKTHRRCRRHT